MHVSLLFLLEVTNESSVGTSLMTDDDKAETLWSMPWLGLGDEQGVEQEEVEATARSGSINLKHTVQLSVLSSRHQS